MASSVDRHEDCKHVFLAQTSLPISPLFLGQQNLPSIYINPTIPLTSSAMMMYVEVAQSHLLNHPRPRESFVSHIIKALRKELAQGMTRDRREQIIIYILSLADPKERAAAELYLSCYPGFFLNGEGGLDLDLGCGRVLTSSGESVSAKIGSIWKRYSDEDTEIEEQKKAWFETDNGGSGADLETGPTKRMSDSEETLGEGRKDGGGSEGDSCAVM